MWHVKKKKKKKKKKKLASSTIRYHLSGIALMWKINYGRNSTKSFKINTLLKSYEKCDLVTVPR